MYGICAHAEQGKCATLGDYEWTGERADLIKFFTQHHLDSLDRKLNKHRCHILNLYEGDSLKDQVMFSHGGPEDQFHSGISAAGFGRQK